MFLLEPTQPIQKDAYDAMDSRERILFGTMELIAREGFEAASTRAIAAQAKLTIGMIWKIFGTKESLMQEVENHTAMVLESCFERMTINDIGDVPQWIMNVSGEFAQMHRLEFSYFRRALAEGNASQHRLLTTYYDQCEKHYRVMLDKGLLRKDAQISELSLNSLLLAVGVLISGPWIFAQTESEEAAFGRFAAYNRFLEGMLRDSVGTSS